ncbi:MAG: hypothetical protein ACTSPI_14470 [Candidatus Heimdallarchaeaceae archaeon]
MALDDSVPADGDGITTGVKVSELAGHIRNLKTDLNNDFATLEYVNASLAANTLNLFLTDTSSAEVGGYYEMLFSETGSGGSSLTENSVSDGETLLWSYISPQFAIADQISAGLYVVSIWVEQNSNKTVTFAAKLYKRDSGGTETELVETSTSDTVTKDTKTQIIMSGFLENDTSISSTDRVVLKIYSNVSGGGGAPDITIYMEGTDDSRAAVRIPTSVITKKIFDADGDTYITVEETADEDKIHFYIAGTKRLTIEGGDTSWHEVGTAGEPAFLNGWVNYGGVYSTMAFRKDALGFVHLKGMVKDGTIGLNVFILPEGYRPAADLWYPAVSNSAFGDVVIKAGGDVGAQHGSNTWFSFSGITFYAGF